MKTEYKIVTVSTILGLLFWILDAVLDTLLFYKGTFWDLLALDVPPHELYIRFLVLFFFIIFGLIAASVTTKYKKIEKKASHLNDVLRAMRNINQFIVGENDRDRLLQAACDSLVQTRGYHHAWIALLDQKGEWSSHTQAGMDGEFLPLINQLKHGKLPPCGKKALHEKNVITIQGPITICADCPLTEQGVQHKAMIIRLEVADTIYGLLSASIPREIAMDQEEQDLFHEVAGDIALALHNIEAEKRLQALSLRHQAILSAIPDIIMEVNNDKIYTWANQAGIEFFGEDVLNKEAVDYFVSEQETYDIVQPIFNGDDDVIYVESWQRRRDDQHRLLAWWCRTLKDDEGNVLGALSTARDITERTRAEIARQQSKERLEKFINSALDSFHLLDAELNIIEINKAALQSLIDGGSEIQTKEDALGRNLFEIYPFLEPRSAQLLQVIETGESFTYDDTITHPKQGDRYLTVKAFRVGEGLGIIATDITSQKKAEQVLQAHSEHLEELVNERTRELRATQEELIRKEKLAALGQLAGGLGHELRNPLGVISNAVYYLQMVLPDADETIQEYLEIISSEVDNSVKIITDLLDLARTRPSAQEPVTVAQLVTEALHRRPLPQEIITRTELPPDLPMAFVDILQIEQVLGNLITNACQAMPEGGDLTICAQLEGNQICLSITDTGCGIARENLRKLFQPLFTTKARGIGLGLTISKNLAEANGGTLTAVSKEGEGSTFTLTLPAQETAA